MYVVATCGVLVVGVQFNIIGVALDDIKRAFTEKCKREFALRDDEVADVRVENVCDCDAVVTALSFMDRNTDECYKVIRRTLTAALKDTIAEVYTDMYKKEMLRKVQTVHEQLFG